MTGVAHIGVTLVGSGGKQPVFLAQFHQPVVDLDPGAIIFRVDLALAVLLAAAGTVDQTLGTLGNGADAAGAAQHAVAAHPAVFVENTHPFHLAQEHGVIGRIDRQRHIVRHGLDAVTADEIIADITACNEKIAAITGVTPTLIRCPYGEYDDHVISAIRSMGMEPIQWDVDSLDWKDYDAATICSRVTGKMAQGSIALFHNAALHTPEALPDILESLIQKGLTVVPISQLIYTENYTIDHTGRQFAAVADEG